MSDDIQTRDSSFTDQEIQLQNMQNKYEQMAQDHDQSYERDGHFEYQNEEDVNLLPIPCKIIMICLTLLVSGTLLFTIGLVDILDDESQTGRDISLLVIGVILLIPGVYYTYQLMCACFAKTKSERELILNEFPLDYYE